MPNPLIRNVSQATLTALKDRAARLHRSLQQEVLVILESAASESPAPTPAELAAAIRSGLAESGRTFTDSTPLVREDRQR
ncbi:MAG: hypothetical protein EPO21_10365 [Chloroflexota bacterium]|nr:MAG: hypothetical protein EPO21_10365 [Chloroflexota bacterium]